jgi:hypothetical protein
MTVLTKKTVKLLCARSGIARSEMTEEAQKLYDLSLDPNVAPEQKQVVIQQLDELIQRLEDKVQTSRRVRGDSAHGNP